MRTFNDKQLRQEQTYFFPYHHLVSFDNDIWKTSKTNAMGYEYLGILNYFLEFINDNKPKSILDFGCGDGKLLWKIARRHDNIDLAGIDYSISALNLAKTLINPINDKLKLCESLTNFKKQVNLITSSHTLEHIPPDELPDVIKQLHIKLLDDGTFLLCVPTTNLKPVSKKHYQHFSIDAIRKLTQHYFKVENFLYTNQINWKAWLKIAPKLYKKFIWPATQKTGSNLIVILKKI